MHDLIEISNEFGTIKYFKNDEEMLKQVGPNLFFEQDYVVFFLKDFIEKSQVILDVGAHCGSHTLMYKSINPDCTVHSFEPQSKVFDLLQENVKSNNLTNVYCYNNAVGHLNRQVEMDPYSTDGENNYRRISYGTDSVFNIAGVQVGAGGESVEMITIDSLDLDRCDFIKIDVEGYEPLVIEGAVETIKKFRPAISYESNIKKSPEARRTSQQMLIRLGYSCMPVWGDNWVAISI